MTSAAGTVTRLLRDWRGGRAAAFDELVPVVYAELQRIAARHLRSERPDHSLKPADLVSEAYLRLSESEYRDLDDRLHFFAIAARTMRQLLVDHARKRNAAKRGDGARPVTFDEALVAGERPDDVAALDEALVALAVEHERKARIVELHYFGGLTQPEIATVLDIHVNTVARDLRFAEAWIQRHIAAP
jgi:RNA polymerase sigma factor (TIGR02999 family)